MAGQLVLGIDISTTAAKALLIDGRGAVVATAATALALSTPRPLWSEQDPHDWWAGAAGSIRRALQEAGAGANAVAAVGLTGQMHGLVLLDEAGAPSRRDARHPREPRALDSPARGGVESDHRHASVRPLAGTGRDCRSGWRRSVGLQEDGIPARITPGSS